MSAAARGATPIAAASGLIVRALAGPPPRAAALEAPVRVAAAGALAAAALGRRPLARGFATR